MLENGLLGIDGTMYVAIPGFINAASESLCDIDNSSGCTTVAVLGNTDSLKNSTVIPFATTDQSEFTNGTNIITKQSPLVYKLNSKAEISPIAGQGRFYGSGTTNVDIWSYLQAQLMRLGDLESMRENVLSMVLDSNSSAANNLGLNTGVIENGKATDLIILKLDSDYCIDTAEDLMLGLILQKRSLEGVFKNGKLVFASDEFAAKVKQVTLSTYYTNPNLPICNSNGGHVFDSIESALQDFSYYS